MEAQIYIRGSVPACVGGSLRVLTGFFQKGRGLLKTGRHSQAVVLKDCASVHTFGMRYALDLAFIGYDGLVLRVCRDVKPGRLRFHSGTSCVVERPSTTGNWLVAGQRIELRIKDSSAEKENHKGFFIPRRSQNLERTVVLS